MTLPGWLRISRRAHCYRTVFQSEEGKQVLSDLKQFCRLERSTLTYSPITGMTDPIATQHAEGRREVLLRIMKFASLTYEDIAQLKITEESANDAS